MSESQSEADDEHSKADAEMTEIQSESDSDSVEDRNEEVSEDESEYNHVEDDEAGTSDEPSGSGDQPSTIEVYTEFSEYIRGKPFISVNRIHTYLSEKSPNRVSRKASAALIGVIQSLMADLILGIKTYILHNVKTKMIRAKIISMTIQDDLQFTRLLSHVNIPESGIFGSIGPLKQRELASLMRHQNHET